MRFALVAHVVSHLRGCTPPPGPGKEKGRDAAERVLTAEGLPNREEGKTGAFADIAPVGLAITNTDGAIALELTCLGDPVEDLCGEPKDLA